MLLGFLLILSVFGDVRATISDLRLCGDPECKGETVKADLNVLIWREPVEVGARWSECLQPTASRGLYLLSPCFIIMGGETTQTIYVTGLYERNSLDFLHHVCLQRWKHPIEGHHLGYWTDRYLNLHCVCVCVAAHSWCIPTLHSCKLMNTGYKLLTVLMAQVQVHGSQASMNTHASHTNPGHCTGTHTCPFSSPWPCCGVTHRFKAVDTWISLSCVGNSFSTICSVVYTNTLWCDVTVMVLLKV